MKLIIFILFALLAISFATTEFRQFTKKYNKNFATPQEFQKRQNIFLANKKFIDEENAKNHTFTLGINEFADLTHEEFTKYYLMKQFDTTKRVSKAKQMELPTDIKLPATVDWRQHNCVTHIKNQGQCGSCWSFSTTGSVEGAFALTTGHLISLSEQQLVDCSDSFGNQGCDGGLMDDAFQYIISAGGLETESRYPYTAEDGTCQSNPTYYRADITSYTDVTSGSEDALQVAVANIGPISVAIDAGQNSFQFYSGGVYYSQGCSPTQLDHGVLAVGYGTYQGSAYWLVKNSWGTSWGLSGYIMMSRNRNNNCGIATMASYPTGAKTPAEKFQKYIKAGKIEQFDPLTSK